MRLGHCNTSLIIYRLYYYSNNCMVDVSIFPQSLLLLCQKELCLIVFGKAIPIKSRRFDSIIYFCDGAVKPPLCWVAVIKKIIFVLCFSFVAEWFPAGRRENVFLQTFPEAMSLSCPREDYRCWVTYCHCRAQWLNNLSCHQHRLTSSGTHTHMLINSWFLSFWFQYLSSSFGTIFLFFLFFLFFCLF